ncbi:ABC transporter permease [Allopusillimonas soli]|uniref:ABC transporter permease n=1 Tax=Allopusillimonas soli TaxID=659016 RepID=UPI001FD67B82|nr:ABC transporter permease [Allopusillimonas soli]
MLFALVLREMQTRLGARRMGWFWILFESAAHIAIMMLIFSTIHGRDVPGMEYSVFLLTGLVPFFLMRNIALKLMDAVNANRALFAYPNIRPFDTFVARTIVEFCLMACVYLLIAGFMALWLDIDVSIHRPLEWIASLSTGIILSFGLGLIFCVIAEVMPNAKTVIRLIFWPLYFVSGIIFPIWAIPSQYMSWLLWNPYLHIFDNVRSATFAHFPHTEGISYLYPLEVAIITLFLGISLYWVRRRELLAI